MTRRMRALFAALAVIATVGIAGPAQAATVDRSASCNLGLGIAKTVTSSWSYNSSNATSYFVKYRNQTLSQTIVIKSWGVTLRGDDGVYASASWTENLKESQHNLSWPNVSLILRPRVTWRLEDTGGAVCTATTWLNV